MERLEQGRFANLISGSREQVEPVIKFGLERYGFVRVEGEQKEIKRLRLLTQRSTWTLKGVDYLLDLPPRTRKAKGETGAVSSRLFEFKELIEENRWKQLKDPQMRGILERVLAVPSRKKLLHETLGQAFSFNLPREQILSARERLEQMLDVIAGKQEKPNGTKRAMILTQTAYLLGKEKGLPYGFNSWLDFGIKLGGGALPYLGAAVVYSELMNTGEFKEIEIADFRDEEAIKRLIADKENYDLVLVSGATTYDTFLIAELNKRLSTAGLLVINGGIATTISVNPERFLQDGVSVFVGEFEGAAEAVLERLESDSSPTIFIRGSETAWGKRLRDRRAKVVFLENLPRRVDMEKIYSVDRERKGYLARRLEALAMMRPMATFGGDDYEPPPIFRPHETNVSYGCPNTCVFCATVKHSGREMRVRSIASISQEWQAVEAPFIGIVDQNLTANGRTYVELLLKEARRLGKRVAFEGELNFFHPSGNKQTDKEAFFFDGSEDDDRRERLLKEAVLAIAVGLEQPIEVKGSRQGRKDPMDFAIALKKLNELGLITFGTAMVGMPKELWSKENQGDDLPIIPLETMTEDEWERMLSYWLDWFENKVPSPGAIPFAFTLVPGTPAFEILKRQGKLRFEDDTLLVQRKEHETDLIVSLNPNLIKGIDSRRAIEDLRRRLYALPSIMKRMKAANFSPKKFAFMFLFNLAAGVAIRDKMI